MRKVFALIPLFLAATAPHAVAEDVAKNSCQEIGHGSFEAVGDREHHTINVVAASCRVTTGPLDGAIITAQYTWEWDKGTGALLFGGGVVRKNGSLVVYEYTEGKTTLTMADGKVTGFVSTGKGRWPIATGGAAALAGKAFTWVSKPTGEGAYETVWTAD